MNEVIGLDPDFLLMEELDVDGTRSWHIDELALVKEEEEEAGSRVVRIICVSEIRHNKLIA